MLTLKSVQAGYGRLPVLKGISLHVRAGEVVTLIGGNGAGKTTTLRTISGLLPPRKGAIEFAGHDLTRMPPERIVTLGLALVPEGRRVFRTLSVTANLELGAYHRRDKGAVRRDLEEIRERFPILKERAHQAAGTLSGGEQQILAIGRALMARPRLLMLDEPSMGLAPRMVTQVYAYPGGTEGPGHHHPAGGTERPGGFKGGRPGLRAGDRPHHPGRHRRGFARRPGSAAGLFGQGISGSMGIKEGEKGKRRKGKKGEKLSVAQASWPVKTMSLVLTRSQVATWERGEKIMTEKSKTKTRYGDIMIFIAFPFRLFPFSPFPPRFLPCLKSTA